MKIELEEQEIIDLLQELKTNAYLFLMSGEVENHVNCTFIANRIETQYEMQKKNHDRD